MPLHQFECFVCGLRKEEHVSSVDVKLICPCGTDKPMQVVYDWGFCNVIEPQFQPYWEENLDRKPIFIESKQQLAKECKSRGLMANRLRDGYRTY